MLKCFIKRKKLSVLLALNSMMTTNLKIIIRERFGNNVSKVLKYSVFVQNLFLLD